VDDINSPWRTTLITGVRGSGKTALLSDIRTNLENNGVIAIYVIPNEVMLDNVLAQLYRQLPKSIADKLPSLKNISVSFGVSVNFEKEKKVPNFTETFPYQIIELLDAFKKQNKSIVFLIDEAQKHTKDMRILISTYQDLIMREYPVNMVLAGMPSVISDILNDEVLTFLRRAKQIELDNIELMIVNYEFKKVFLNANAKLTNEIVSEAAAATHGYPYLIQLVGYYLWDYIQGGDNIDIFNDTLFNAKMELFRNVHKLVFNDLSNKDRDIIFAMSEDTGCSSVSVIGERLHMKKNIISIYRERLISAGVVKSCGRGLLRFNYPYMREFLINKKIELDL